MNSEFPDSDSHEEIETIDGGLISELDSEVKWHAERHRAQTASKIAFMVLWIMALSLVVHYMTTLVLHVSGNDTAAESLQDLFAMWLPVVSGLVGAAVTYYFTRRGERW